jgi:hypothetical protein
VRHEGRPQERRPERQDEREWKVRRMIFEQLNPHACRTYLIGDEKSGEAILVDPVLEHVE